MAKWTKPSEGLPECNVGDRVVVILAERETERHAILPRIVVLNCEESGWSCDDAFYSGYTPSDGVLWSLESDVCQVAYVACPEAFG